MITKNNLKICRNGHRFYKSSDCPVCPVCENERKLQAGFLSQLGAPARRALENKGLTSLQKLAGYSKDEILELHGMGPSSIPILQTALKKAGLSFKK